MSREKLWPTGDKHIRQQSRSCQLLTHSIHLCAILPLPPHLHEIMMSDTGSGVEPSPVQNVTAQYTKIRRQYQQMLDRWTPHIVHRWLATAGLLAVFMLRILIAQGVSTLGPYLS